MTTRPTTLTIPKPDDWHLHLRDGAMMKAVVPYTARHFARAIVMPNLKPPIRTTADAAAYRERILAALPEGVDFTPLMTAYLTDTTNPDDLEKGFRDNILFAAKLYPAGATTNSDLGVTDVQGISHILDRLQRIGMPLSIHGEFVDPSVDFFDREAVFIERILIPMRRSFPELRIILEHLTTKTAVHYVMTEGQIGRLAGTITPHHLWINRSAIFENGISPHLFCLPIAKREEDRQALIQAATSGASMIFAGTDSAPHPRTAKETANGAGGIFGAANALSLYAEIFDHANALNKLGDFLSTNGATFYKVPVNTASITLEKSPTPLPPLKPILTEDGAEIVVFPHQSALSWRIIESSSSYAAQP
ncbi:MAG: dihydroorotase [Proteobacteria bacterium]|jgi:dihydroorotase|nr:dihydroorotase [Alphaproteobacteria bacterium]NCC03861.1 dihydroorotase [Pseudomonadota bacterium]